MKVIFDTSFIVYLLEKPSTVFEQLIDKVGYPEIIAPESVYSELVRLSKRKKVVRKFKELKIDFVKGKKNKADEDLIELSRETGYPVFTLDLELAKKLAKEGLPCFTVADERLVKCFE